MGQPNKVTECKRDRDSHRLRPTTFLLMSVAATAIGSAYASDTLIGAIGAGTPIIDLRLRIEEVDQSNKPKIAAATTIRARLGYQTGEIGGLAVAALADFDFVQLERLRLRHSPAACGKQGATDSARPYRGRRLLDN